MTRSVLFLIFLIISGTTTHVALCQVTPLPNGHSHNDYEQDRPLFDALAAGMTSIEVDIFFVEGRLLVAHDIEDVDTTKTLTNMYLKPLSDRVKDNSGKVYVGWEYPIQLLIDLKSDGRDIHHILHKQVEEYGRIFSNSKNLEVYRPLQVVLSGEVEKEWILQSDEFSHFFVDGRISDLSKKHDSNMVPLISMNYTDLFKWQGAGKLKRREIRKLKRLVKKVHLQNKALRFWATSDNVRLWDHLLDHGVDLINVDDLRKFVNFVKLRSN